MPARKTTTAETTRRESAPVLFIHATGTLAPDPGWLESIQGLDAVICSHAALPGITRTKHRLEQLGELVAELHSIHPQRPVVFVRAGIELRASDLDHLLTLLAAPDTPQALTVLSNAAPELNPFASLDVGCDPGLESMRTAVYLMGKAVIHPWPWLPDHLLALAPGGCARLVKETAEGGDVTSRLRHMTGLAEWLFVPDLRAGKFRAVRTEPNESARPPPWGALTLRLQDWLVNGAPDPVAAPESDQPVTLHITHSWGGGVDIWTRAFIDADTEGLHLQLRSESVQSGKGNGQRLALYIGNDLASPISVWWLQPPIQSIEIHNTQYTEALEQILERYVVDRVLISSLIGHSLDALATGRPTLQVLHDHFPLWPLLSVHPSGFRKDGGIDLDAALRAHSLNAEFTDHDTGHWVEIRDAYLDALEKHDVKLAAPSRSVIDVNRELDARMAELDIALIPHGNLVLDHAETVRPIPRADGKLRLLVPGRIQPGKGKSLLLEALPSITQHAHVYLVGSGKNGEDFFGLPGVSVLFQYERLELPRILAEIGPHAAALLSIVPETFSYTLSELQQLGIPVIATRRGAFAERLEHGKTGWLIEPEPDELIATVEKFSREPAALEPLALAFSKQSAPSLAAMVHAYNEYCPPQPAEPKPSASGLSLVSAQAASYASEAARRESMAREINSSLEIAQRELSRRTRWAEEADQALRRIENRNTQLQEELDEREQWARQANKDVEAARARIDEIEAELEERAEWARQANKDVEAARARIDELEVELEERTQWARHANTEAEAARKNAIALAREAEERTQWALQADAAVEVARTRVAELEQLLEERTAWAQSLDQSLEQERQDFQQARQSLEIQLRETHAQLSEVRSKLHQSRNELQAMLFELHQTRTDRQSLQDMQDLIVSSISWRLTRPLRVVSRAMRNAWQARIYNPARWPLLLSKLARYLVTQGPGGTLRRLQAPAQSDGGEAPATSLGAKAGARAVKPVSADSKAENSKSEKNTTRMDPAGTGDNSAQAMPAPPIEFTPVEAPLASIVIPAFNQWAYTRQCLASLAETQVLSTFEVIVIDDASSDETEHGLSDVKGAICLRNESNSGFIRSCNRAAEQARGEFIVFLNNDTEVNDGWLDRLLEAFEREPKAGLVGARLVYPDGRLQECGGMIFNDGSGWNYGKHDDPEKPEYQYLREVDYCSGACIALRAETWHELGGFDEQYAPAYYEDTDLAFRVRELGQKVLVQPEATIVHHEGITSGTDVSSGTKRYQEVNREKFLARWTDQLQQQPDPITDPKDLAQIRRARDHRLDGHVLIIDATTPEPDQDSGSVRLTNVMRCFRDLGYGVTFFADNRMHAGRYTRALQQAGVEVQYLPWLDPINAFFETRGGEFDFVFISRHYIAVNYLSLLKQYCLDAPFIFDTVDLHYLREQRLAELENSATLRQVAKQTRRSELSVIAAADATVVVSPTEVEVLERDAPGAMVHVLSNIHDVPGRRTDFADRKDLFFVGGYQHPPNIDAACWFVGEIWPLVREKLPDAKFHLIGSKARDEVRNLAGNGVVFHGFVEDLEPWLDGCRLAVAPLRYGAGVKGKVNMSMSHGQPVVATPVAVEGMYAQHGREVLVAETAAAFADEIVKLYSDEALWLSLSEAAIRNVETHFSMNAARRSLENLLERLDDID